VQVGAGGTSLWKLCTVAQNTTLAVVYDIVAQHGTAAPDMMGAGACSEDRVVAGRVVHPPPLGG